MKTLNVSVALLVLVVMLSSCTDEANISDPNQNQDQTAEIRDVLSDISLAIQRYHNSCNFYPEDIETLVDAGLVVLSDQIVQHWNIRLIPDNPVNFLFAISNSSFPDGPGITITYDIRADQFGDRLEGYINESLMEVLLSDIANSAKQYFNDHNHHATGIDVLVNNGYIALGEYLMRQWEFAVVSDRERLVSVMAVLTDAGQHDEFNLVTCNLISEYYQFTRVADKNHFKIVQTIPELLEGIYKFERVNLGRPVSICSIFDYCDIDEQFSEVIDRYHVKVVDYTCLYQIVFEELNMQTGERSSELSFILPLAEFVGNSFQADDRSDIINAFGCILNFEYWFLYDRSENGINQIVEADEGIAIPQRVLNKWRFSFTPNSQDDYLNLYAMARDLNSDQDFHIAFFSSHRTANVRIQSITDSEVFPAITAIHNIIGGIFRYNEATGESPPNVQKLIEQGYCQIDDLVLEQWHFSLIGAPVTQIEAISSSQFSKGEGCVMLLDTQSGFYGFGVSELVSIY